MSISATSGFSSSAMYESPMAKASANQSSPFAKLAQSDPALAKKLQGFSDQLTKMKQQGASSDQIQKTLQDDFSQLTASELSELKTTMGGAQTSDAQSLTGATGKKHHKHLKAGGSDDQSSPSTASSIISGRPIENPAVAGLASLLGE